MWPAPDNANLTLDELHTYMQERVTEIERYLDSDHGSSGHADVLSIRRHLYLNLIDMIDRGYTYNPPATAITPDAGKPSLWLRVQRWGRSF